MKVSGIRVEEGVIVGCIVALIVGAAIWVFKWLELDAQQRAAADAIRNGQ